jgi:glycosyltransferase involved in cell wall biosynthesis
MEGLPIVLMEAMALGTAVIAPRLAGIPELVEDGHTGLLFTPSNWSELEIGIERLLMDDGLRLRLADEAHKVVTAHFDITQSAEKLVSLFADATASRSAPVLS